MPYTADLNDPRVKELLGEQEVSGPGIEIKPVAPPPTTPDVRGGYDINAYRRMENKEPSPQNLFDLPIETAPPKPIELQGVTEDVQDVSYAIQRAARAQQKETGQGVQYSFRSPEELKQRSQEISSAIQRLPGDENVLGLGRTLYSFATTAAGTANAIFGPMFDPEKYDKKFEGHRKAGSGVVMSYFKTLGDAFDDATGKEGFMMSEGEAMKSLIDYLAGKPVISAREAETLTAFGRPEASIVEQGIRLVPEIAGLSGASIKLMLRNRKEIVKLAEDFLKEKKGPDFSIKNATNQDIVDATRAVADARKAPILRALRLERPTRPFYEERAAFVLQMEKLGGFKGASKKLWDNNKKIRDAKKKRSELETNFLKSGSVVDNDLVNQQNRLIAGLKSERRDFIPKVVVGTVASEALGSVAATYAANTFGEDNVLAITGAALGGGILGPMGLTGLISLGTGAAKTMGMLSTGIGSKLGLLSEEQVKLYMERGSLGIGSNLSSQDRKALQEFSAILQLLPEEFQDRYIRELQMFSSVRDKLAAIDGVDPDLLETTLGNAMNLLPLMLMRQSVADATIDMASGAKGVVNKDLIDLISSQEVQKDLLQNLRSGLDTLSSQALKVGYKDAEFVKVMNSLETIATNAADATRRQSTEITNSLENIQRIVTQPLMAESFDDLDDYKELLTKIAESDFVNRLGQTQREGIQGSLQQLGRAAEARAAGVTQFESEVRNALDRFGKTFNEEISVAATDNALKDFTNKAELVKATVEGIGRGKFQALKNIETDVTDWFEDLYSGSTVGSPDTYTSVIKKGEPRLTGAVAGTTLQKGYPLEKLAEYKARSNADQVIRSNATLREEFKKAFDEGEFYKPDGFGGVRSFEVDEITYDDVKSFISSNYSRPGYTDLSDFDSFRILKNFAEEAGIDANFRLMMKVSDMQDFSSEFMGRAARYYDTNRKISDQYSTLSKSIIDAMPDELGDQVRDAKKFWLDNVIVRYRDKDNTPIGYYLDHTRGDNYVKDPAKWINMRKIIRQGSVRDAQDLEKQLARVFGFRNAETGEFEIKEEERAVVKNLLTNLLSEELAKSTPVLKAQELGKIAPDTAARGVGAGVDDPFKVKQELAKRAAISQRKQKIGALRPEDKVLSKGMEYLESKGLIDRQAALDYNLDIDRFDGTVEFRQNLNKLEADVKQSTVEAKRQVKLAENYLQEVYRFSPEFQAQKIDTPKDLIAFFVTNPRAVDRIDALVPKIAKELNISDTESRKVLSDLVLDAISKETYDVPLDITGKGTVRNFKYNDFYDIVEQNSVSLKRLLDGTDTGPTPVYDGAFAIADFLRRINRSEGELRRAAGVRVAAPKGLSVESLLSRGYSIIRGVVSPKYVATEVALRSFRQRNANVLAKLASDPKMVDAVIDMLEVGETSIRKYNASLYPVLVGVLAQYAAVENQQASKKQIRELELDQFKLGER